MLRFIDLRGQGTGSKFTFYDTGVDKIVSYNGNNVWDKWEDFESDYEAHAKHQLQTTASADGTHKLVSNAKALRQRYKSLCPAWLFADVRIQDKHPEHTFRQPVNFQEVLNHINTVCDLHNYDHDDFKLEVKDGVLPKIVVKFVNPV